MTNDSKIAKAVDSSIDGEHILDIFHIPNRDYENELSVYLITRHGDGEERYPDTVYAEDIYEVIFDNLHCHSAGKYEYKVNVYEMQLDRLCDMPESVENGDMDYTPFINTPVEFIESIPVIVTGEELEVKEKGIRTKTHVTIEIQRPDPTKPNSKGKSQSCIWTCGDCKPMKNYLTDGIIKAVEA